MAGNWIKGAIKNPGALHRDLGIPAGQKIPAKRLAEAARGSGVTARRARLAQTLRSFSGGGMVKDLSPAAHADFAARCKGKR